MKKIFYLIILLLILHVSSFAQAPNDSCHNAEEIHVVTDGPFTTVTGTTLNATPELYDNTCGMGQFPTVWYKVVPPGDAVLMNIQVESADFDAPSISVFHAAGFPHCDFLVPVGLTQSNFACIVGSRGVAEAFATDVGGFESYYIAVTSFYSLGGEFEISINTISSSSACVIDREIEITHRSGPGSLNGPFSPGETVGVCMNVNSYTAVGNGCQWFQGLVPIFGNGWDPSSFDPNHQPLNATINGLPIGMFGNGLYGAATTWDWFSDVGYHHDNSFFQIGDLDGNGRLDMCHLLYDPDCPDLGGFTGGCCNPCWDDPGEILPPGWFAYGMNGTCATPGPPISVDWGDGNTCGCCMGPWKFCFDLKVRDFPDCAADLSLGFFTFADGEVGSWTGGPSICAFDQPSKITLSLCCDSLLTTQELSLSLCNGDVFNYPLEQPTIDYWEWILIDGNIQGAHEGEGGPGSAINDTLINPGLDTLMGTYRISGFKGGSCRILQQDIIVRVYPGPDVTLAHSYICGELPDPYIISSISSGGTGNYNYLWLPSGDTTMTISIEDPMQEDEFSLIVSDGSACVDTATTMIDSIPSLSVSIISTDSMICHNLCPSMLHSAVIGGTAPFDFLWTLPDGQISTIDSLITCQAGIHTVGVTDLYGCTGFQSMEMVVLENPVVEIIPADELIILCDRDSIILSTELSGGVPPYYHWWDGPSGISNADSMVASLPGIYIVTVTDSLDCHSIADTLIVALDSISLDLGPDTLETISPVTLDAGAGWNLYQWNTNSNSQSIIVDASGWYSVTVTDILGCTTEDSVFVDFITILENTGNSHSIKIYPNPTTGKFIISGDLSPAENIKINIYNALGSLILNADENSGDGIFRKEISLQKHSAGLYFIHIQAEERIYFSKIILQ